VKIPVTIRSIEKRDRSQLKDVLKAQSHFKAIEIKVALELIDYALTQLGQEDYNILCAEEDSGEILGYICYGKAPLTDAVYDLYWIVVHPSSWKRGAGTSLLLRAEEDLRRQKARQMLIETSSLPPYEAPRTFYRKHGYKEHARLSDYYAVGDHKLIFAKTFHP